MTCPNNLWSLWQMLDLNAKKFLRLMEELNSTNGVLIGIKDVQLKIDETLRNSATEIRELPNELGLPLSEMEARRLESCFAAELVEGREGRERLSALSNRISDELTLRKILVLSAEEFSLYEQETPMFGADVATKFPSIAFDIAEAGKCLAMERSTASAFHSIRCLEAAIRAIARCLGIPDPTRATERSWANVLKAIRESIDQRWPYKNQRFAGGGQKLDQLYGALSGIQNPYRDSTMHLDKKYTQPEAKHIMEVVKGLLISTAERMDENGEPKA